MGHGRVSGDGSGVGSVPELLLSGEEGRCLVIFEARRYSRMAKVLAEQAKAAGKGNFIDYQPPRAAMPAAANR